MANPVIHFEVHVKDGKKSQNFYKNLFDWHIDANNPIDYGVVDTHSKGINGGVTVSPNRSYGYLLRFSGRPSGVPG